MKKQAVRLVIASTTSTQNSGLFDILIPAYEKATRYNIAVEVIAVGTGKAIRMAKKGEADLLFVHDPLREEKFVTEGYGVNRRAVMHNVFVIVGPAKDPARVKTANSAAEAIELIAEGGFPFVSREMIPERITKSWTCGMMTALTRRARGGISRPAGRWAIRYSSRTRKKPTRLQTSELT